MPIPLGPKSYLRYVYEFLFCQNIGLVWILSRSYGPESVLLLRLQYYINDLLGLHPHIKVGGYVASFGLTLGLAICAFFLVLAFEKMVIPNVVVRWFGGIASVVSLPICWFYALPALMPQPIKSALWIWPLLETMIVVLGVCLFSSGRREVPDSLIALCLVIHHLYWGYRFFGAALLLNPIFLVFPLVGISASVSWLFYANRFRFHGQMPPEAQCESA
jgi:hypothetical protein